MGRKRIKVSELTPASSLAGYYAFGYKLINGQRTSVKLDLSYVQEAYEKTVDATEKANEAIANTNKAKEEANAKMEQIEQEANQKIADLTTFETTAKEQEADRVDAEKKRKAEEGIRKTDEAARVSAEELREQGESNRIAEEGKRVSAEEIRDSAEQARIREEGTRNTQEQAREDAEDARVLAEKNRVTEEGKRDAAEALRNQSEQTRVTEEGKRDIAEHNRVASEVGRGDAEKSRISAETGRDEAEKLRVSSEADRKTEEGKRDAAERAREDAEAARVEAERLRAQESREAIDKAESSAGLADLAAAAAQETADHPTYVGDNYYIYKWNKETKAYDKTDIFVKGDAFSIKKVYPSISKMEADLNNPEIKEGHFVLINTNNVEDPDNAQLYIKTYNEETGVFSYEFVVDMSGAIGFTGKTPQFSIGNVSKGDEPAVSLSPDGTDADGNPKYKLNIVLPKGDTGNVGPIGPVGPEGKQGPIGPKGDTGAAFTYDMFTPDQLALLVGPVGPIGPKGEKGDKGDKGDTGAQGPQGLKGDTGTAGPAGKNLEFTWDGYTLGIRQQGQTAYTYSQSLRGATGATGAQGPKGDKGDTGATGPAGAKGATGATGPAGKNLEFTWNGYTLGVRQQGQTAYTYSQSLRGATGATGAQGPKGDKGDTGATGPAGAKGATGATGPAGKNLEFTWNGYTLGVRQQGQTAYTYSQSLRGATGATGPQGPKGDKGDTGARGATGPQGPQGPAGASGANWNGGTVGTNIIISRSYPTLYLRDSNSEWQIQNSPSEGVNYWYNSSQKFRVATTGNVYCAGEYSKLSDIRIKSRIEDLNNVLDKIKGLSVFYYTRTDLETEKRHLGVSAQEVIEVFPEVVSLYDELYSVDYSSLAAAVAIAGLNEVRERLEQLEQKLSA